MKGSMRDDELRSSSLRLGLNLEAERTDKKNSWKRHGAILRAQFIVGTQSLYWGSQFTYMHQKQMLMMTVNTCHPVQLAKL